MEGLDIVIQNGIKSYSYELTRTIARRKGLPIPEFGFDPKIEIIVGQNKVICYHLGEAHTKDGIVIWIPSEKILFGGNGIRNHNGWVGNIGDANLKDWSNTVEKIKDEFGTAKIVIPGHGKHGGTELLDYTIELYKTDNKNWVLNSQESFDQTNFEDKHYLIIAESDSMQDERRILENAVVYIQDSTKYVKIESPLIIYDLKKKTFDSEYGYLEIYDKKLQENKLRIGVPYNKLIIIRKEDSVGLRIVLREFKE